MICLIIVNSVNLALDTPLLDPSSNMSYNLQKLDYLLSGLFVVEAVVKIIAVGFYNCGKTSYIRNSWNVLDFIVIIITVSKIKMFNFYIDNILYCELTR